MSSEVSIVLLEAGVYGCNSYQGRVPLDHRYWFLLEAPNFRALLVP